MIASAFVTVMELNAVNMGHSIPNQPPNQKTMESVDWDWRE